MTENFANDAHDYLLNQMDPARRRWFEQELQRNAAARAALKSCADSLAGFACEVAAPEALSAADHEFALGGIMAEIESARGPGRVPSGFRWKRLLWPAAAAILLGLNLLEFDRPLAPGFTGNRAAPAEQKSGPPADPERRGDTPPEPPAGTATEPTPAASRPAAMDTARTHDNAAEIARLRANLEELRQARDTIRAEYDLLVRRLEAQAVVERNLNRLATMELVDAASYARGERRGLVGVGRGILTEPGVVIDPAPAPAPGGTAQTAPRQPYAWSVFDEQEQRGYLNLYQLPALPAEQGMQVWVRSADTPDYQRVGEVPAQYHGGNGSVQYTLPTGTGVPAEILITIEPRNAPPSVPTGPTVVRGP